MARGNRFSVLAVNDAGCWEDNEPLLAGKYKKKRKRTRPSERSVKQEPVRSAMLYICVGWSVITMCQGYSGMNHCQSNSAHRVQSQSV